MTMGHAAVDVLLNGRRVSIDAPTPQTTLLDALRSLGLTSLKEGCAEGECGTCMVALVANGPRGAEYRPVNSCLMLLPMAAGHEIHTAEGLATEGRLSEAQAAMAAAGGSQCGYCTPGFVVSLFAEQYRPDRDGPCDPMALAGNLCRCTGYRPIAEAAQALGPPPDDRFSQRLVAPAPSLMRFETVGFSRPDTLAECLALLEREPEARIVAGATDVAVEWNLKRRGSPHMVSVEAIDELREFTVTSDCIRIGSALPLTDIARAWRDAPAAVHQWLELFASPPIRNRATLGGNLATASPIGDSAPLLLALDATIHVAGTDGRRSIPISSFFAGYRQTTLDAGELVTTIEIPKPLPTHLRFYKVSKRRLDDISTVAAAFAIDGDEDDRVRRARVAFGGVGPTAVRVIDAEAAIVGRRSADVDVARIQDIVATSLTPMTDHRGSREYRLQVAQALVEKFFWEISE